MSFKVIYHIYPYTSLLGLNCNVFNAEILTVCIWVCSMFFQGILHQLHTNCDIIKQVTNSLVKFHQVAYESAGRDGLRMGPDTLVDGRYTHKDVSLHLTRVQITDVWPGLG